MLNKVCLSPLLVSFRRVILVDPISRRPCPKQEASQTDIPGAINHTVPGRCCVMSTAVLITKPMVQYTNVLLGPFEAKLLGDVYLEWTAKAC